MQRLTAKLHKMSEEHVDDQPEDYEYKAGLQTAATIAENMINEEKEVVQNAFYAGMRCQPFDPNMGTAEMWYNTTFNTKKQMKTPIQELIDFVHAELKSGKALGHEYPHLENVLLKSEELKKQFSQDEPKTPMKYLQGKLNAIECKGSVNMSVERMRFLPDEWEKVWEDAYHYEKMYIEMTEQYGAISERRRIKSQQKKR
jgi:hypothetical protein